MKKKFNITGTCIPHKHYMADTTDKIKKIIAMIEEGEYFTIARPRQYGKTTTLYLLDRELRKHEDYLALKLSFEGIDAPTYAKQESFIKTFLEMLVDKFLYLEEKRFAELISPHVSSTLTMAELSRLITRLVKTVGLNTVLIIDEVDKSSNNQLFLDFLGMLRTKFLQRSEGEDETFHSVILAGVHDVKTLKAKIHPGESEKLNSPWNIAVDFNVDLSFAAREIVPMLEEYSQAEKVKIDIETVAGRIFYYTSGYPFLVSKLCKVMHEEILSRKAKREWEARDLDWAVQEVLKDKNTNFSSLIKNLESNGELYDLVFKIIMNGLVFSYNTDNPVIHYGSIYGILTKQENKTKVHNRMYEQRIYNYMTSKLETSSDISVYNDSSFIGEDGYLNMEQVLRRFQVFMKAQYSVRDAAFIERNGRLLFLAFIKPIINGRGFDFKEVQISDEKRLDVVVTFGEKKYIIELKIWRGESYHQKGILQLCDYLETQDEDRGYLLIYDLRKESARVGDCRSIQAEGKNIFMAWV
ncbi:MAG: AAA family ATPase [bacterium]|nr:AAA family ATPase [bacterium]